MGSGAAVLLPRKADGDTVPLLRETITLIPVSTKGTEKSTTSDLSSLIVSEPMAMSARLYTTCSEGGGRSKRIIIPSALSALDIVIIIFFPEPTAMVFPGESVTFLHSESFFFFFLFPSLRF